MARSHSVGKLGPLEAEVINEAFKLGEKFTVRDIFAVLYERKKLAYTTVLTICTRLSEKGVLARKAVPGQAAYIYNITKTREQILEGVARNYNKALGSDNCWLEVRT